MGPRQCSTHGWFVSNLMKGTSKSSHGSVLTDNIDLLVLAELGKLDTLLLLFEYCSSPIQAPTSPFRREFRLWNGRDTQNPWDRSGQCKFNEARVRSRDLCSVLFAPNALERIACCNMALQHNRYKGKYMLYILVVIYSDSLNSAAVALRLLCAVRIVVMPMSLCSVLKFESKQGVNYAAG
jgi:hypothetical protein